MAFGRLRVDELETSTQVVSVDALTSGGISDGDKGDITVSGAGTVWTIDDGAVDTAALGGDITAAGKALLDDADAAAQRTTLGAEAAGTAASTISAHEAAADPHPGYALESDLGGAALLDVGTTAGTVAAGDDSRLTTDLGYTASTRVLASSTGADVTLPLFTSTDAGLTPLSGGGTSNFLRADGTWATPATGGTPGGTTGQLQWNSSDSFAGVGGSTVGALGDITLSLNGTASTPPFRLTGTWFTGGTTTTTKPHFLIEPAGTTSTAWDTRGTGLGVNAPSGFPGNLLDLQVNGTSRARVNSSGHAVFGGINIDNFTLGASNTGIHLSVAHVAGQLVLNTSGASWSVASGTKANLNTLNAHAISFGSDSLISQGGYSSSKNIRVLSPNTDVQAPSLTIQTASALSTASTNIVGGNIALIPGSGASASAESADGGNILLDSGQGYGTGTDGNIIVGATRGNLQITDARNVILGTTTGTKIGTATTQKLGFYNATPVVQPTAVADITTTATSGSLPTPDGTVTIADATTPTVTELLEYCVELEAKLEAALGHLRTLGLIAT